MHLPHASLAVVERSKVVEYLLNAQHRDGSSKAKFFAKVGFRLSEWGKLAAALVAHGREHPVSRLSETGFGPRFEVVGNLKTPAGRSVHLCTVWQIDKGEIAPRLITAYPLSKA